MVMDGKTLDRKLFDWEETRIRCVSFFNLGSKSHLDIFHMK